MVLAIILIAGAITAGWIMTMTSEMEYVAQFSESAKRRIATENATALVRQYLLVNVLTKAEATGASGDLGGGWGSMTIPDSAVMPLATFSPSAGYNHFNPGNGGGYSQDLYSLPITMAAGGESISRRFLIKSRSSVLSGTPAAFHMPSASVSGSLSVAGQTLLWQPAGAYTMASISYATPSTPGFSLIGGNGTGIPASNFPFIPLTGSGTEGTPSIPVFDGTLNVIANTSGINSLAVMSETSAVNGRQIVTGASTSDSDGVVSDGAGKVTIDLLDPDLGNVLVEDGTDHLILKGQSSAADRTAAGNAAAVLIIVHLANTDPATNIPLEQVEFQNSNHRKLVLAIKTASGLGTVLNFPQAGPDSWRLVLTLENTPVTFQLSGASQDVIGGLQTDQAVSVQNGSLNLVSETDPKLLDRLTARDGWIEVYTP